MFYRVLASHLYLETCWSESVCFCFFYRHFRCEISKDIWNFVFAQLSSLLFHFRWTGRRSENNTQGRSWVCYHHYYNQTFNSPSNYSAEFPGIEWFGCFIASRHACDLHVYVDYFGGRFESIVLLFAEGFGEGVSRFMYVVYEC